ncbi:MAG: AccI family restriction endonuclease, partial [Candidatus Bathyarchaeia archaeon]
ECRSSTWILEKYRKVKEAEGKDLNFTAKEEDLEVLIRWSKIYNNKKVYYVQLFFDSSFALSFDKIMYLLQHGRKRKDYLLKVDRKTGKKTYFIPVSKGIKFADCVEMPTLDCETLVDEIGQVVAIRTPKGGKYVLSEEFVNDLLRT